MRYDRIRNVVCAQKLTSEDYSLFRHEIKQKLVYEKFGDLQCVKAVPNPDGHQPSMLQMISGTDIF